MEDHMTQAGFIPPAAPRRRWPWPVLVAAVAAVLVAAWLSLWAVGLLALAGLWPSW